MFFLLLPLFPLLFISAAEFSSTSVDVFILFFSIFRGFSLSIVHVCQNIKYDRSDVCLIAVDQFLHSFSF